jgi:hypothetical protein
MSVQPVTQEQGQAVLEAVNKLVLASVGVALCSKGETEGFMLLASQAIHQLRAVGVPIDPIPY